MVAMATAEYYRLTGDAEAGQKTRDILAQLPRFQNADGSFPHWCTGSRDVHYTGWMAMELILLQRTMGDALIAPTLDRMNTFMEGRVGVSGETRYQEPCPNLPNCTVYYYSRATGCAIDYDTRDITVEPSYSAILFDHMHSPKYGTVMHFLRSLEHRGTFADQWGYWPPPSDPQYPWTVADTSVANMSIIFWSLAGILSGRPDRAAVEQAWIDEENAPESDEPDPALPCEVRLGPIRPNPASNGCAVAFALPAPAPVSIALYDAGGRKVRELASGWFGAGEQSVPWDRRDSAGRETRNGLYFVRLIVAKEIRTTRVLVIR